MKAAQLFERIPEHLRDVPHPGLQGETPREAMAHVENPGCLACREVLRQLGENVRSAQ